MASGSSLGSHIKGIASDTHDLTGLGLRVGVVRTEWNAVVVDALADGAQSELRRLGLADADITTVKVPGAYELPSGAQALLESDSFDAVICIGCLIKGSTMHFEYICEAVTQGIMRLNLDTRKPVIFGVLACLTEEQALERAGLTPGGHNHGVEWAQSAVKMARLRNSLAQAK